MGISDTIRSARFCLIYLRDQSFFIPWGDQRILGDHLIFRRTEGASIEKNLEDAEGSLKSAWTTPAV